MERKLPLSGMEVMRALNGVRLYMQEASVV